MSAETLRHAAARMREAHGPDHPRHEFWHRLADLLDSEAVNAEAFATHKNPLGAPSVHVIAVAHAYLGSRDGAR
jgi:hypothetical protein